MSREVDREINQLIRSAKVEQLDRLMLQIDAEMDDLIKQLESQTDTDEILWRLFCKDELHQL